MNTTAIKKMEITAQTKSDVDQAPLYRFRLMQGVIGKDGKFERARSVGLAYLKEGQGIYRLRLWMFSEARYYLIASEKTTSHYMLMTREPNQRPGSSRRYHWNIVGSGQVETMAGVIRLKFDLLSEPIYMSLFPEEQGQAPAKEPQIFARANEEGLIDVA